ncbi:MAG: hypothetical protein MZV70_18330 [Desulfobacterales bacterium]|nr:hypothetical protein [Desulfobacterales bacterium]
MIVPAIATNAAAQARPNLSPSRASFVSAAEIASQSPGRAESLSWPSSTKRSRKRRSMGRTGEVRRLLAQGQTLLAGREWTDDLDFSNSLVLRADAVVLDSKQPGSIRIEHTYAPRLQIVGPLHGPGVPASSPPRGPSRVSAWGQDQGSRDAVMG